MPAASWPSTIGSGNVQSPFMMCQSLWQTPAAMTLTRASPAWGPCCCTSTTSSGVLALYRIAAFIERFDHLEVVVPFADQEPDRLAGRRQRGGEVARLALELRRLERAVRDDEGGVERFEMALRAQRLLHLVGELDVRVARRQAHGLQVVHAAGAQPALHRVRRKIEAPAPIGGEDHAGKMGARGVARDVDAVGIAAEAVGVALHPRDGAAHLRGHRDEAATDVLDPGEVRYHEMPAGADEELGRERVVPGEAGPPRASMDEDVDRRIGARGGVHVEAFDGRGAVCVAPGRAKSRADGFAVGRVALDELLAVWRPGTQVVGGVELGLIHVEPDTRLRARDPSTSVSQGTDGARPMVAPPRTPPTPAARSNRRSGARRSAARPAIHRT